VAIKFINKKDLDSHEINSILTEVNVTSNLTHPNIVRLVEAYEDKSAYMLVFELMNGGELYERICDKEQFSEAEACNVMQSIIDALKYCHSQGVAHRDIKPENLLYEEEGEHSIIKLADFGMAKIVDTHATRGMSTVCGTAAYTAPEVMENQKYGFACDVWSMGCVLYVMLCGSHPFDSDSNEENEKSIKMGILAFPSPDWDNVSGHAKDLVKKMLTADPYTRITPEEILKRPWIEEHSNNALNISEKLKKYNARRRFKKAGNVVYAAQTLRLFGQHHH